MLTDKNLAHTYTFSLKHLSEFVYDRDTQNNFIFNLYILSIIYIKICKIFKNLFLLF